MMTPLEIAISAYGSVSAMADGLDVARSLPSMWKARGNIPAEYCPRIERDTGVRCEDLRPDVDWAYLRGTSAAAQIPVVGVAHE